MYDFDEFRSVIKALRHPETGCPWDRVQTHETLIPCLIEETYEVIEGIRIWQNSADAENFCEELGDLLLQVVMQSQIASEEGLFTLDDVINNVCDKMYRRHPHVFGDVKAENAEQALSSWDAAKMKSKSQTTYSDAMRSISKALPALMRSEKIQKKASKVGFDWDNALGAMTKLTEECNELNVAIALGNSKNQLEEVGDVLFTVVNVARFLDIDSEYALELACEKFITRFAMVEQLAQERGINMSAATLTQLDSLWEEVKIIQKHKTNGGN